jgi:hypothetical protein
MTGERLFCNVNVLANRKPQFFSEPFHIALMPGRQHAVAELADPGFGVQRNVHKSSQRKRKRFGPYARFLQGVFIFSSGTGVRFLARSVLFGSVENANHGFEIGVEYQRQALQRFCLQSFGFVGGSSK